MPSYLEPARPYTTSDFQLSEIFPGRLWIGEMPGEQDLDTLKQLGITDIINLISPEDVLARQKAAAFQVHHYPFPDGFFASPQDELRGHSLRMMTAAAQRLDELMKGGKPTYLHCVAGISRSPTVYMLWLIRGGHALTFREALTRTQRARPIISPNPDLVDIVRELHPKAFEEL